jgi:hypothetical protein
MDELNTTELNQMRHCMKVIDKYVQIVILIDSQHYICYTM